MVFAYYLIITIFVLLNNYLKINNKGMKSIPNDVFFEEVERLLSEGKPVKIIVQGTSMSPHFISGKDYVVIYPVDNQKIKSVSRGDIVLFHIGDSVHLHRIIHYFGTLLEIRGDGCYGKYEKITSSDIIGIVKEGTFHGGKPFKSSSFGWKMRSWFWMHTYFMRHQIVRLKRIMHHKTASNRL